MPDRLKILFVGDIIGRPGRRVFRKFIPILRKKYAPDMIVANGENAAGGIGITEKIAQELFTNVDVITSGNHIWDKKEVLDYLDRESYLLRPANYPEGNPGKGSCVWTEDDGIKIGVISLQGRVFMEPIDCPFRAADREVAALRKITPIILVDIHAEATSEKQALGWYLDGRVSAVLGTHTHVPTADKRILPRGTAYMSDVGMVGGYDSVIGIRKDQALMRFLSSRPQRFEPSRDRGVCSTVCITVDSRSDRALDFQHDIMIEESVD